MFFCSTRDEMSGFCDSPLISRLIITNGFPLRIPIFPKIADDEEGEQIKQSPYLLSHAYFSSIVFARSQTFLSVILVSKINMLALRNDAHANLDAHVAFLNKRPTDRLILCYGHRDAWRRFTSDRFLINSRLSWLSSLTRSRPHANEKLLLRLARMKMKRSISLSSRRCDNHH